MAGSCILSRQRNATHHVLLRDSLRNDNDKGDLVLDCIDGCRHGKWRRHVDDGRIWLHRCFRLLHGVENGQTDVCSASLLGRDAPDHIGAISDGLLTVKRALRAGKALADYTRVLVHCRRRTRTHEACLSRPLGRRPGNVAKSAHSRMHPATHNTKPRAGHIRLFRAMQTAADRKRTLPPDARNRSTKLIRTRNVGTQKQRNRLCKCPPKRTEPPLRLCPHCTRDALARTCGQHSTSLWIDTASRVASEASRCWLQWKAHSPNSVDRHLSDRLSHQGVAPGLQNDGRHG